MDGRVSRRWWVLAGLQVLLLPMAHAQIVDATAVTPEVIPLQRMVPLGQPVWVDFRLHNPTSDVAVLYLSGGSTLELNPPAMGLPLAHAFGVGAAPLLEIEDPGGAMCRPRAASEDGRDVAVRLAPLASVGLRVDLAAYCPSFAQPGRHRIRWQPYGTAAPVTTEVIVVALKQVRVETDHGTMTLELFYDDAPRHVQNFIELIEDRFYDGLSFHRIEPEFLIQGGAPGDQPAAVHPSGRLLDPEFNPRPFQRGTLGMARRPSDPNSASCQFFICGARWPDLDGQYTAFGQLVGEASFSTLDRLMAVEVGRRGVPRQRIAIRRMVTEDAPFSERAFFQAGK